MTEILTWGALIAAASSLIALAKLWMDWGADRQRITNLDAMATATMMKTELVSSSLAQFKIDAAREFASAADLAGAERRFATAIDNLGIRFDRMADRLDRVLETISAQGGRG